LTRRQLDCKVDHRVVAKFRDKRRLIVVRTKCSISCRHALYTQLDRRILKHGLCRIWSRWWQIKGKNPATLLASLSAIRGSCQKTALSVSCERCSASNATPEHVLTALENEKKLSAETTAWSTSSRTGSFDLEWKSQGLSRQQHQQAGMVRPSRSTK